MKAVISGGGLVGLSAGKILSENAVDVVTSSVCYWGTFISSDEISERYGVAYAFFLNDTGNKKRIEILGKYMYHILLCTAENMILRVLSINTTVR
ncbi:MAG: hypothetical protein KAU03_00165 [Candidatus Altiarchaeales archaeon]|nr:hypothetical protein [Candidatus Altiarchaeales archaeon]